MDGMRHELPRLLNRRIEWMGMSLNLFIAIVVLDLFAWTAMSLLKVPYNMPIAIGLLAMGVIVGKQLYRNNNFIIEDVFAYVKQMHLLNKHGTVSNDTNITFFNR